MIKLKICKLSCHKNVWTRAKVLYCAATRLCEDTIKTDNAKFQKTVAIKTKSITSKNKLLADNC